MIPPVPPGTAVSNRVLRALRARRPLWRFLSSFCAAADSAGAGAYLVGGFVRDLLEGRPGKDVDLMVTGIRFDALGVLLRSLDAGGLGIRRVVSAGRRFEVYRVFTAWTKEPVDVALARSGPSAASRRRGRWRSPQEEEAREDASRRDFTMNSVMFRLAPRGDGLGGWIVDPFGGIADLRGKRIRGVGDPRDRFREDPLRILRAIRFRNERPGFVIEPVTWGALAGEVSALIRQVPAEGMAAELSRSLAANPSGTVADLFRSGILASLLPEIADWGAGPAARMQRRYRLLERSLGRPLPETPMLANLLADVAEREAARLRQERRLSGAAGADGTFPRLPRTGAAARRLHLPRVRRVVRMLEALVRLTRPPPRSCPNARAEALFARQEDPGQLLALYAAVQRASARRERDFRALLRRAAATPSLLSGDDLVALGVPAGPQRESILLCVREATLAGRVRDRRDALRLAGRLHRSRAARRPRQRGGASSRRDSKRPIRARRSTEESGRRNRREAISSNMKNDDRSGPA